MRREQRQRGQTSANQQATTRHREPTPAGAGQRGLTPDSSREVHQKQPTEEEKEEEKKAESPKEKEKRNGKREEKEKEEKEEAERSEQPETVEHDNPAARN